MGIVTNGTILLLAILIFNQLKASIRRNASKIPFVTSTWSDGLKGKSFRAIVQTGYDTYSKTSKTFRANKKYILPPSLFAEVRRLPSSVLHSSAANEDILKLERNLGPDYYDVIQFVRQTVIRSIPSQIPMVREEIRKQFINNYVSVDGSWRPVAPWQTTFDVMSRFACRLLVGDGLCSDEIFIKKVGEFTRSVSIESILLHKLPDIATSILGPLLPAKSRVQELTEMLRAPIMACVQEGQDGSLEPREKMEYPNDSLLPQLVHHVIPKYADSQNNGPLTETILVPAVSGRLLGLLFAVIDTTTMTFTQTFFDLISHPSTIYAEPLRREIRSVLDAHNGEWTATALADLKYLDSFIHESQRLHPISPALAARKVMPPAGWTFSNGDFVPCGALVQLPVWPVHMDESSYEHPEEFRGFRFVDDAHPESTPTDTFLAFGHGNHACPGRRFALVMVKLMIIEILMGYEFEELDQRPEDWLFGAGIVPNMKKEVRMRRAARAVP